jgi:predicted ester cyclase
MISPRYQQLADTAKRWMNEIWTKHDFSNFDILHHEDFQDLSPAGRNSTREEYHKGIEELFAVFPDFSATVEDLVVDEFRGKVSVRWSASAVHQGKFLGIKPTYQTIFFQGIEIIAIDQQGFITERWGEWDGLSLLQQLTTKIGDSSDV